jgi:hypothetical protein
LTSAKITTCQEEYDLLSAKLKTTTPERRMYECSKKNFLEKTSTIPTRKPYQQKEELLGKDIRKNEDCRINRRVIIIP